MRRIAIILGLGLSLAFLWGWLPHSIAAREEAVRASALARATQHETSPTLAVCPAAGPARETFLDSRERQARGAQASWLAACEEADERLGKPIIVTNNRSQLRACEDKKSWTNINVICSVMESLQFLAEPEARRTWARQEARDSKGRSIIWITTRPMAWRGQLVAEYRERSLLLSALVAVFAFLFWAGKRLRVARALRAASHGPDEPDLPPNAELLIYWILGRQSRSLPGDLSEEYASMLDRDISRAAANRWYRWQVFHSIAPMIGGRLETMLEFRFRSRFLPPKS